MTSVLSWNACSSCERLISQMLVLVVFVRSSSHGSGTDAAPSSEYKAPPGDYDNQIGVMLASRSDCTPRLLKSSHQKCNYLLAKLNTRILLTDSSHTDNYSHVCSMFTRWTGCVEGVLAHCTAVQLQHKLYEIYMTRRQTYEASPYWCVSPHISSLDVDLPPEEMLNLSSTISSASRGMSMQLHKWIISIIVFIILLKQQHFCS